MQTLNRNTYIAAIWVLCLTLSFSCSRQSIYSSLWQPEPIQINTRPPGWDNASEFDRTTRLHYAVSNDQENMYVFLKSSDRTMQMKMLRAGVQLGIDTTGGKNVHLSLHYPFLPAAMAAIAGMERLGGTQSGSRPEAVNRFLSGAGTMHVSGFPGHDRGELPHDMPGKINVNLEMDEREDLHFWAVIPLKYLGVTPENVWGKPLALTVSLPGIDTGQRSGTQRGGRPTDGIRINPDGGRVGAQPVGDNRPRPGMQSAPADPETMRRTQSFHLVFNLSARQ